MLVHNVILTFLWRKFTLHVDMIKCAHQVLRLPNYLLSLYFYNNCDITFSTVFILTHPLNFPCGRKPEHSEKTNDFRQSVDWLFSRVRSENRTHGLRVLSETCAFPTEGCLKQVHFLTYKFEKNTRVDIRYCVCEIQQSIYWSIHTGRDSTTRHDFSIFTDR
jgi:hypothetical protein